MIHHCQYEHQLAEGNSTPRSLTSYGEKVMCWSAHTNMKQAVKLVKVMSLECTRTHTHETNGEAGKS